MNIAIVMYKVSKNDVSVRIQNMFKLVSAVHHYNTKSSIGHNYFVNHANSFVKKHTLKITGTVIWNELEITVKSKRSLTSFKKCIKKQLLAKYIESE